MKTTTDDRAKLRALADAMEKHPPFGVANGFFMLRDATPTLLDDIEELRAGLKRALEVAERLDRASRPRRKYESMSDDEIELAAIAKLLEES